jgi:hypothetical protein
LKNVSHVLIPAQLLEARRYSSQTAKEQRFFGCNAPYTSISPLAALRVASRYARLIRVVFGLDGASELSEFRLNIARVDE